MKSKLIILLCSAILLLAEPVSVSGQYRQDDQARKKVQHKEWAGAGLTMIGGSLVGGGMIIVGIIGAFAGESFARPLLIAGFGIATATPLMAGYVIHQIGQKNGYGGKFGYAVLGCYAGVLVSSGISSLTRILASSLDGPGIYALSLASGLFSLAVPALTGVYFYNKFPKKKDAPIGLSLINTNNGKVSLGIPTMTMNPHPILQGEYCKQISLVSMSI